MRLLIVPRCMISGFSLLIAGIVLIVLVACDRSSSVVKDDLDVLGISAEIVIVGLPGIEASKAVRAVEKDLESLDHIGYTFESAGELSQVNAAISQGQAIAVSEEMKGLLKDAHRLYSASNGLFNPAAGELTALWEYDCDQADCSESHFPDEVRHLIDEKASEVIRQQPSMDDIRIDGNQLTSGKSVVKLEFGDIIRGFALDQGINHLKEMGVDNAMIFLGNGVVTLGTRGKQPWWIGLPILGEGEHLIGAIESSGHEAVVTVHAFDKSISRKGEAVYRHVVDPRSGLPVKATKSVTVIHDSATTASAAAAALLINGTDGWSNVADKMDVHAIMMITQDGIIYTSPKMEERIHWKQELVHRHLVP